MRKMQVTICFCLSVMVQHIYGQTDSVLYKYDSSVIKEELNKYGCTFCETNPSAPLIKKDSIYKSAMHKFKLQCVQSAVLDSGLFKVFTTIIPNSSGLVNTGTAFAYSQNTDKATLNLNTTYTTKDAHTFLNVGIISSGKDNVFNLYSDKSWANEIGLNIGISHISHKKKPNQFFNPSKCMNLKKQRRVYMDTILFSYKKIYENNSLNINELKQDSVQYAQGFQNQLAFNNTDKENYIHKLDSISKLLTIARIFTDSVKMKKMIQDSLIAFDSRNNILYGYSVLWWNANIGFINSSLNLNYDSTISKASKSINNYLKIPIDFNLNWNHRGRKTIQYIQGDISFQMGSFLDNPAIGSSTPNVKIVPAINTVDSLNIYNADNGKLLGTYNDIKKQFWQFSIGGYYANFFLFDRSFGLSIRATHNVGLTKIESVDYKNNFTFLFGTIFKMQSAKWSAATFGVNAGFENIPYHVHIWNFFGLKAFIGIPFRVFDKKDQSAP